LIDSNNNTTLLDLPAENDLQQSIKKGHKIIPEYLKLSINGGRCLILPENEEIENILKDPNNDKYSYYAKKIFKKIASFLNGEKIAKVTDLNGNCNGSLQAIKKGSINLTPDFGRFAGVADILNEYTAQVLGVKAEKGGGGGKVNYSVTSIISGWESCIEHKLADFDPETTPITIIGSAGALGAGIVDYVKKNKFKNVTLCDIQYDLDKIKIIQNENDLKNLHILHYNQMSPKNFVVIDKMECSLSINIGDKIVGLENGSYQSLLPEWKIIAAKKGRFTDEALRRGGTIITTTIGNEIEHSNYNIIPKGTLFLAAHNIAIPLGEKGNMITKAIHNNGTWLIPGQILTLGGALTARYEACFRSKLKTGDSTIFPKRLAHEIVRLTVKKVVGDIILESKESNFLTPWHALLRYADLEKLLYLKSEKIDFSARSLTPY
jgi:hypothetical protein